MKKIIFLLVSIALFSSCNLIVERKSYKFELRQLDSSVNDSKSSNAWFFIAAGSYSENTSNESVVKVFAKVDGMYRLIKFPLEMARINIDNSISGPNIQLVYRNEIEISDERLLNGCNYLVDYYIINCPEIYLPEKLIPIEIK